jgi:hypothetical protein
MFYKKPNPIPNKTYLLDTNRTGTTSHTHVGFSAPEEDDIQNGHHAFCAIDGNKIEITNSIFHIPNSMPLYLQAKQFVFKDFCLKYRSDITKLDPQTITLFPSSTTNTPIHSIKISPSKTDSLILNGYADPRCQDH